jgi:hypothetical protein
VAGMVFCVRWLFRQPQTLWPTAPINSTN